MRHPLFGRKFTSRRNSAGQARRRNTLRLGRHPQFETLEQRHLMTMVSLSSLNVNEGSTAQFTVDITDGDGSNFTLSYQTIDGTASSASDYSATTSSVVLNVTGSSIYQISVPTAGDSNDEIDETFSLSISAVGASVSAAVGVATIIDDDTSTPSGAPTISVGDINVNEGDIASFTVSLSHSTSVDVVVEFNTSNGTATSGSDYTSASGSVTISAGSLTATAAVSTTEDSTDEYDETFTLTLSNPSNATISDGAAVGTILDDDGSSTGPTFVYVTKSDALFEGNPSIDGSFEFARVGSTSSALTVSFNFTGNAEYGTDYEADGGGAMPTTITFGVGEERAYLHLDVIDDDIPLESTEYAFLQLVGGSTYTIGEMSSAWMRIWDDEPTPVDKYVVSCDCPSASVSDQLEKGTGNNKTAIVLGGVELNSTSLNRNKVVLTIDMALQDIRTADHLRIYGDLNGNQTSAVYADAPTWEVGEDYPLTFEADVSTFLPGVYSYSFTVESNYGDHNYYLVERVYRKMFVEPTNDQFFGHGWNVVGYDKLYPTTTGAYLKQGDGNGVWFNLEDGGYTPEPGNRERLSLEDNSSVYTLTDGLGRKKEFDSYGRQIKSIDHNGNVTHYNHTDADSDGQADDLTTIVSPTGKTTTFAYTGGRVTSITDPFGRISSLTYNSSGELASTIEPDPDGAGPLSAPQTSLTYDGDHRVASYKNANDESTSFTYGVGGSLVSRTDPTNVSVSVSSYLVKAFAYAGSSGGTSATSPAIPERSTLIRNTTIEVPDLGTTTTKHDRFGNVTRYQDDDGNLTIFKRSKKNGWLSERTDPDPDGTGPLVTPVTSYSYDDRGNLAHIQHPDSSTESWTYHWDFDRPLTYVNANGNATKYLYDSAGNLLADQKVIGEVDGDGNLETDDVITSFTYTNAPTLSTEPPKGLLASVIDPLGRVDEYDYDADGFVTTITYAVGTSVAASLTYGYDSFDRLATYTDELGRSTTYQYDALDRLLKIVLPDPDGSGTLLSPEIEYRYDPVGRLKKEIDALDRETSYTYNARGELTKIERPDHDANSQLTTTQFGYSSAGFQTSFTDPLNRVTSSAYNTLGQLTSETLPDPDGGGSLLSPVTSYTYDKLGRLLTTTDALLNVTSYAYGNFGREVRITRPDPDGAGTLGVPVSELIYDAIGHLVSFEDALGRITTYDFDELGRRIRETLPDPDAGGILTAPVTEWEYDKAGNLRFITDPLLNVTEYRYDERNRLIKAIQPDPDGGSNYTETEYEYDDAGQLIKVIDPLDRETIYDYDDLGQLIKLTQPDPDGVGSLLAPETLFAYDAAGRITSTTDARGNVTSYEYDLLDNLVEITSADPDGSGLLTSSISTWTYDAAGQLISFVDALTRTTSYEYDYLGRTKKVTQPDPDGGSSQLAPWTTYSYDAIGNVLTTTDRLNHTFTYEYDDLYRVSSVTNPNNEVTSFTYDEVGNRLTLTDPELNTTTWTYDALDRVKTDTNELNKTRTFEYDSASNLTKKTDRLGRVTEYAYDDLHRLKSEKWKTGGGVVREMSYTYDAASQLRSASDPSAEYGYDYDALGRLIEITADIDGLTPVVTLAQGFDAVGNRTSLSATIGSTADFLNTYTYDSLNRQTQVKQEGQSGGNAVGQKRVDYTYNKINQFSTIARYASLNTSEYVATSTFGYDQANRLTSIAHAQGVTDLAGYDYAYDAASRITSIDSFLDGLTSYSHDNSGQLTDADHSGQTDEDYTYDDNGNRVMAGHSVGDNNQLLSDGTYDYEYDDEGNRTAKETIATGERVEYTWDHRNRLVTVTFKNSLGVVIKTVDQAYDVNNQWIRSTLDSNGPTSGGVSERFFIYDGTQIALEFDGTTAGDVSHRYLWGPSVDQLLADEQVSSASSTGSVVWPLADHLGTIRDLATYNAGTEITTIANHRRYDSFGNLMSETNSAVDLLFGFTGRAYDEASGLQNNWNRWYDAGTGQWMGEDPIGFSAGDVNIRRYVRSMPTGRIDPDGLRDTFLYLASPPAYYAKPYIVATGEWFGSVWGALRNYDATAAGKLQRSSYNRFAQGGGDFGEVRSQRQFDQPSKVIVTNLAEGSVTFTASAGSFVRPSTCATPSLPKTNPDPSRQNYSPFNRGSVGAARANPAENTRRLPLTRNGNPSLDSKRYLTRPEELVEAAKPSMKGRFGTRHEYENPGTHDPTFPHAFDPSKSVLPSNHLEMFAQSRPVIDDTGRVSYWTVERRPDGSRVYHRFMGQNDAYHWNGSTDSRLRDGTLNAIKERDVPAVVRRW